MGNSLAAKIVGDQALLDLLKEIELSGDEPLEQAPSTDGRSPRRQCR
jgi:hypothetical protein